MSESNVKRSTKAAISAVVWSLDRFRMGLRKPSQFVRGGVVLLYHDVSPAAIASFTQHIDWLASNRQVVPLSQLSEPQTGRQLSPNWRVAITFDDAVNSFGQRVLPVLQQRNMPATLFVPSALLGDSNNVYMTHNEVATLPQLIEIGSHSRLHRRLSELSAEELASEVHGSKMDLETLSGRDVCAFAFPFGDWNAAVETAVESAGYTHAYSVRPACVRSHDFVVPRVTLEPTDSLFELRMKADGAYRWMGHVMAAKQRFLGRNV
jgi:peptidoglycan/xylan/chitin deacetylase (PgdA/CDA1 family)